MTEVGRNTVAKLGPGTAAPTAVISGDFSGLSSVDVSVLETERTVPGGGAAQHQLTSHREGTVGFTIDDNAVTRPLLWPAGGTRMTLEVSPTGEAAGAGFTRYTFIASVSLSYGSTGVGVFTVSGDIETAPVVGTH